MPEPGKPGSKERTNLVPIFAAFCFFLSTVEYVIPKPLPFMRLGISNLPLLLGVAIFSPGEYVLLVLAKIVGMSLVSGTLFSYVFVFSFAGSAVSGLIMYFLKKTLGDRMGYIGISVLGAAASNGTQIGLASVFVFGQSALLIAPPFLAAGAVTGLALGIFAERFAEKSSWYAKACAQACAKALAETGKKP